MRSDTTLKRIDGIWTLIYQGDEYARLLDARSQDDAEMQAAEMAFLGMGNQRIARRDKRAINLVVAWPAARELGVPASAD